MQEIESKFHDLLKEITGETYNTDEQSKIVAHASSIFNTKFKNKRIASKLEPRVIEAYMNDAILQAMSSLDDWDEYSDDYVDCAGLNSNQALRKVAQSSKSKWGKMEVLNPEVLKYLDWDEEEHHEELENSQQTSEALKTPGIGRHRTDFLSNQIR